MKCTCGHLNPIGTFLCEYCGRPQDIVRPVDVQKEMRYEGRMRYSRLQSQTPLLRIWKFFSSVRVAIYLIILLLVTSTIGTFLPQEDLVPSTSSPIAYYKENYGFWGEWYARLGFSHVYDSWWFISLMGLLGVSLVVCSLDRFVPLYRALNNQSIEKDIAFIKNQRITMWKRSNKEECFPLLIEKLKKKGYHVRDSETAIFAEKGRISRWGPYINHIGLIIFLGALLCKYIPGWYLEDAVWIREGQTKAIANTPFYLENRKSFVELHPNSTVVKKYQTNAILYKKDQNGLLIPVHQHNIQVNRPMKHSDISFFQADFQPHVVHSFTLRVRNEERDLGSFTVNLDQPLINKTFHLNRDGFVRILEYYPDFAYDREKQRPYSRSRLPNRPAMVLELGNKEKEEKNRVWVVAGEKFESLNPKSAYTVTLTKIHTSNQSGLMVRKDKRLPILLLGGMITMLGLIMGFYWQHRRVWVLRRDGITHIGAHTNKNWFGLQTELEKILPTAFIKEPSP